MSRKRSPLRMLLQEYGIAATEKEAEALCLSGNVLVDDEPVTKSGALTPNDAVVRLRGERKRFVSRGGDKLEVAIEALGVDCNDRVALDAGASTGGFTDCLLRRGVKRVYAVDTGYGQLAGSLRLDPRVVNMERTNLSDLHPTDLSPPPSIATLDLSYLSLTTAVPIAARLLSRSGILLCLVKPLFETPDVNARRSGVIVDARCYEEVLSILTDLVRSSGYSTTGIIQSPFRGSRGTVEFFLCVEIAPGREALFDVDLAIKEAVYG